MGKVLKEFERGWAGQVSRSKDDVIISLRNAANAPIPFGAPVFMKPGDAGVKLFNAAQHTAANFVGFAVRIPDKTAAAWRNTPAAAPWTSWSAGPSWSRLSPPRARRTSCTSTSPTAR